MSVYSSNSETSDLEEGEILESPQSYFILYFTDHCTETFILYDDTRFTLYGSKKNRIGENTKFYAEYHLCQIDALITFLFFIYNQFDTECVYKLALYTVELNKHFLSDYGFDFIYNMCGENECLNTSSIYNRVNAKKLYNLLSMIKL